MAKNNGIFRRAIRIVTGREIDGRERELLGVIAAENPGLILDAWRQCNPGEWEARARAQAKAGKTAQAVAIVRDATGWTAADAEFYVSTSVAGGVV